MICRQECS